MPCEHEGRDWGDMSTSQGTLKMASKPPEARREARNRSSLTVLRRNQSCQHKTSWFVIFCYGNPSKLIFLWTQLVVPSLPDTFLCVDRCEWSNVFPWFPGHLSLKVLKTEMEDRWHIGYWAIWPVSQVPGGSSIYQGLAIIVSTATTWNQNLVAKQQWSPGSLSTSYAANNQVWLFPQANRTKGNRW